MSKRIRFLLVLALVGIGAYFIYPSVRWYFFTPEPEKQLAGRPREQIRDYAREEAQREWARLSDLGLTDPDAGLPADLAFLTEKAESNLRRAKKDIPAQWTVKDISLAIPRRADVFAEIENYYHKRVMDLKDLRSRAIQLGLDLSGGLSVTLEADMDSLEARLGHSPDLSERDDAVRRALEIITNRIDQFGLSEPQIRRGGEATILIEIPGEPDPERARSFLMGKGSLNFHIVDEEATAALLDYQRRTPGYSPDNPAFEVDFIPVGSVIRGYYQRDAYGIDQLDHYIVIYEDYHVDGLAGEHIRSAQVSRDPTNNRPTVDFVLDSEGGDLFYNLTDKYREKSLAIVMDNRVKAYARIRAAIRESVQITGFNQEEAQNLALVLRTAALPVDLTIANQQAVGPTMGRDTIDKALNASMVGFLLVVLFMLICYKGAGINADIALLLNVFFMVATLSVFNFTLTLTSIAGIVLTVGMAVDANVIIFERIKEEYHLGKSAKASIEAGFAKAFWAIMDSNITTLIAALFLSQLGKGPIQGFAVTLSIGIITSMFTAIFVSRLIFDFRTDVMGMTRLSISWRRLQG
ncbi:MAG: protein translocase subunit SecD [Spirochaetales bacterium]|jgi:preprotein translocase subunit SecD|nr:protein translocase subunit SecD [Spirochaetales bacterium]